MMDNTSQPTNISA